MSLKSVNKQDKPNLYTLEIEIDAQTFEQSCSKAFSRVKNRISIPGFRKGKVTRKMAERFYGEGFLYEDALELCYPKAYTQAVEESGLDVVGIGEQKIDKIGTDGVLMKIEVYTKPQIELSAYKDLEATQAAVEVSDEEIQSKINELVERNARIITVEDRPAQNGDITDIDYEGFVDGVAFSGGKGENYELTLGSNTFIPGFEDQIVGHNTGDSFDVNVTFPEEYHSDELAGKAAVFKVKLHEIKTKELPEVDDEFASEAADCDTVDELKKSIAEDIKKEKEDSNERSIEDQLLKKLSENVQGDIPDVMIDSEVDEQTRNFEMRLNQSGINLDTYLGYMNMDREDYRDQIRPNSETNVKVRLALEKVIELEGIEATDEDIEKEYAKLAESYGMEADEVKKHIPASQLEQNVKFEKAVKVIRDSAKVTTQIKPETEETDAKENADETE